MILCHTCGNQIAEYSYNGFCSVDCYENQKPMKKNEERTPPAINCPQGLAAPLPPVASCGDCIQCVIRETRILVPIFAQWEGETLVWEHAPSPLLEVNVGRTVKNDQTRITFKGITEEAKASISERIRAGGFTININQ